MEQTITVSGSGRISAGADWIELAIVLSAADPDYGKMMEKGAGQLAELRQALAGAGFARADLKTVSLDIDIDYEEVTDEHNERRRQAKGYVLRHQLALGFPLDNERLGQALGRISGCRANPELTISYRLQDEEPAKAAALRAAAKDARIKAEALAGGSGCRLGSLVSITSGALRPQGHEALAFRAVNTAQAASPIDVEPQNLEFSDSAVLVWQLEEAE